MRKPKEIKNSIIKKTNHIKLISERERRSLIIKLLAEKSCTYGALLHNVPRLVVMWREIIIFGSKWVPTGDLRIRFKP